MPIAGQLDLSSSGAYRWAVGLYAHYWTTKSEFFGCLLLCSGVRRFLDAHCWTTRSELFRCLLLGSGVRRSIDAHCWITRSEFFRCLLLDSGVRSSGGGVRCPLQDKLGQRFF